MSEIQNFYTTQQLEFSKPSNFGRKQYNFDQLNMFCISQGSAVTFFRCGGKCIITCQIYSGSCVQKLLVHFWL